MNIRIADSGEKTVAALAGYFVQAAAEAIKDHSRFSVVLSGGSSPKALYELLASPSFKDKVEWNKVDFFFGDERYVPHTHPDSNYLMAKKALLDPLHIADNAVFPADTSLSPAEAAESYNEDIKNYFAGSAARFDLVLLGLGDDAHTASLFPHTAVLQDSAPAVKEVFLNDKQVYRITMNAPLINQAHAIAFLVYGSGKTEAIYNVLKAAKDSDKYPAQLIKKEETLWFIDKEAGRLLGRGSV